MKQNSTITLVLFIILTLWLSGCQENHLTTIEGRIDPNIQDLTIGDERVSTDANGYFLLERELEYSTIFTINAGEHEYEIFVKPGTKVNFTKDKDTIILSGNLMLENNQLLADKTLNEQIGAYLERNWYAIHRNEENKYMAILDSLKGLYFTAMHDKELDKEFVAVNSAAVNYAFDRMLLRYPRFHFYFTGEQIPLSQEVKGKMVSTHNAPQHYELQSYRMFVKTWLDIQLDSVMSHKDTQKYHGEILLTSALEMIENEFESPLLQDYWSFEFIKTHIDQYTWINGKDHLNTFIDICSTPGITQQAKSYKEQQLADRKDHEILTYKSVKGQQLEVHIFKPENFDKNNLYPALAAFHGGGWISGNAGWTFESAQHAAENGMVGIAVEYRLSNQSDVTPVEAMEDVRDAIVWLRDNADALNIQPDKIVGKGISAGGHLISAISILQQKPNSIPNALVLTSPALDTSDDYFKSLLSEGSNASTLSPLEGLASGIAMPPTLILQGKTDNLTPTRYANQFKSKMDSLGYSCKLTIYENVGHLFTPSHLDDTGWPQPDPKVMRKAVAEQDRFLRTIGYLK